MFIYITRAFTNADQGLQDPMTSFTV